MPSLPSGTVTFVFTDIEDSTALLRALGDGYADTLAEHRRVVREVLGAYGVEIDTQGDAFFFAFPRAREAVAAAAEVQRAHAVHEWPHDALVRVRIGLHTGEPHVGEEGYLGLDVVRAARICAAAQGGQVLLSESTRALLGSSLPDGVSVFPRGERHLKGIEEPERVYELAIEGVELEAEETAEPAERAPEPRADAPPASETAMERRFEDLGTRLAQGIEEEVAAKLERAFARVGSTPAPRQDDPDLEQLLSRSASLEEKIRARIAAALAAKGIRDERSS